MPIRSAGHNSRSFESPVTHENIVRKVFAHADLYVNEISFSVPSDHKEIMRIALGEIGVLARQIDNESHGILFKVTGITGIKKSLNHLRERNLIADQFYQKIVEQFPKAYGGNLDLLSVDDNISDLDFFQNTLRLHEQRSLSALETFLNQPVVQRQEAINGTQKSIIEGTLIDILDHFQSMPSAVVALEAIQLIDKNELDEIERLFLKKHDLLDDIEFLRKIFQHPCPQNRAMGDYTAIDKPEGISEGQVYFWKNGFGTGVLSEPQGLLGLTARNDGTALPITKEATVQYIRTLIDREKTKLEERIKTDLSGIKD
ncbi:MAG: hypothetical protein Q8L98_04095 [Chlamydiales bacterium]|nr:hypothetical protein [Chlamydiales bacterium]